MNPPTKIFMPRTDRSHLFVIEINSVTRYCIPSFDSITGKACLVSLPDGEVLFERENIKESCSFISEVYYGHERIELLEFDNDAARLLYITKQLFTI